jgi:hypothetical protein
MPGNKIGLEMCQKDVFEFDGVLGGKGSVVVSVVLRVNDGGLACSIVSV